jgi:hypothetical protein
MHIHAMPASASGDALAGAQAAETSVAIRRARELQEAAAKLRVSSVEIGLGPPADAETLAMIGSWTNGGGGNSQSGGLGVSGSQSQGIERTPPESPVSYWA